MRDAVASRTARLERRCGRLREKAVRAQERLAAAEEQGRLDARTLSARAVRVKELEAQVKTLRWQLREERDRCELWKHRARVANDQLSAKGRKG